MAEAISTAINASEPILQKIAPFADDQIKLLWGLNEELTKLGDLVSQIEAEEEEHDNQTKNWLEKLKDIMDETGRKVKSINERLDGILKNKDKRMRFQKQNAPSEDIGRWKFASTYMTTIHIKKCPPGLQLPQFHHLPFLEDLSFESIMVDYIDTTDYYEDENINSPSRSQLFFLSLKVLWIWDCPNLKGWWKKKDDNAIEEELLPPFPCISVVDLRRSPNIKWIPIFPTVSEKLFIVTGSVNPLKHTIKACSSLKYLKELWISEVGDLEYMEIELFPSLESVWVHDCTNLRHWGKEGDDDDEASKVAPSVIEFEIKNCPKLTSLPQGMQLLSSSTKFTINGCPLLKQRYRSKTGQDWPQIFNIETDW